MKQINLEKEGKFITIKEINDKKLGAKNNEPANRSTQKKKGSTIKETNDVKN